MDSLIELKNPFITHLQQAIQARDDSLATQLQVQSDEWVQEQLLSLGMDTKQAQTQQQSINDSVSLTQQYKLACANYRELMILVDRSREIKKMLRIALSEGRRNKL